MKHWMLGALALVVLAGAGCQAGQQTHSGIQPPVAAVESAAPAPPPAAAQSRTAIPPAPRVKPAQAPAPTADPRAALAAKAEADYQRGVSLYHNGNLDEARAAFNQALTVLLTSPFNISATPALQQELERLTDHIHALEMNALEAGDGFTAQKAEPAPIDAVAGMTFPVDAATRAQVEKQIRDTSGDLPLVLNDPVIQYIHYFTTSGKGYLEDSFKRAGRYRPMIERILKKQGVPEDLIYLAQAESGFEPKAVSVAGARGMWQFMAGEASDFHLERNWWVDQRQDPEKSTLAAAQYLKELYHQFGDWYLAMAAYNSGAGTVSRAVASTGYVDFWQLYRRHVLPTETRNYVPIILAIALIAKNPTQYGLNKIVEDKPERWDTVNLGGPIDLRLAAELAGTSVATLRRLNPSLLRLTTPNNGAFNLHIPAGTEARFDQGLALIPVNKRVQWRYHRVRAGESLAGIARRYGSTERQIIEVNNLAAHLHLHEGQQLVIPIHRREYAGVGRYRVERGNTLSGISRRFGVSVADLRRWNGLRSSFLRLGQLLWVRPPERSAARTTRARPQRREGRSRVIRYRIRPGDTLYGIAKRFGVEVISLRRWNHLRGSDLQVGHVLVVHLR